MLAGSVDDVVSAQAHTFFKGRAVFFIGSANDSANIVVGIVNSTGGALAAGASDEIEPFSTNTFI